MTFLIKWQPPHKEWDFDPEKPFLVQVIKKAIFSQLVDRDFLFYFKNSLAVMCEIWLRRAGIDPLINAHKNFHILQDEFFKVLAHINRGFELEVKGDWKCGVGRLIELWKEIEREGEPKWKDHREERRKGDPASRFELKEEPKQEIADAFWVSMFRKGRKWAKEILNLAETIDAQQARFFISSFDLEENKTFTATKITILRNTQERWLLNTLSSKLGFKPGYTFWRETFASSFNKIREAQEIIQESNAKLWLIKNFFQLQRRQWFPLLRILTSGHASLERLFGNVIATFLLQHDRSSFELKEEEAGELFRIFWTHGLKLPWSQAEHVIRLLHEAIINTKEYRVYLTALMLLSALQTSEKNRRYKAFSEARRILSAFEKEIRDLVEFPIHNISEDNFSALQFPIDTEKKYQLLISKLKLFLKLQFDIHRVVESIFWKFTETFSDLVRAYKIQKKKNLSEKEKEDLNSIIQKYHLRPDENNFLSYAADRCYVGKEPGYFKAEEGQETEGELFFEKKTQKVKKDFLIPPIHIRRELSLLCGRYGKLIADITEKKTRTTFFNVKLTLTAFKIQITDARYRSKIKPKTLYAIKIKQALPRHPREKWE